MFIFKSHFFFRLFGKGNLDFLSFVIAFCHFQIGFASENVYLSSSYDQLVTSSTLRYVPNTYTVQYMRLMNDAYLERQCFLTSVKCIVKLYCTVLHI